MIFVDGNVFLRYLIQPTTTGDRANEQRAAALFARVKAGAVEITTSDALGAAYSELRGDELATFDAALARTPGVTPHAFG